MPTYEYECQKCGHRLEKFQSMTDKRLKTCPECGGTLQRLLGGGAAVIFKGSGFHTTDYRQRETRCGQDRPCCGRDAPCDIPPCDD
jgi:putative FmdB family regulatory protein